MACFWISLTKLILHPKLAIKREKFNLNNNLQPINVIKFLKEKNMLTPNTLWEGFCLTEKQQQENIEHIKEYDIKDINLGYLCSVCDPFIILITELFEITIKHTYLQKKITYSNSKKSLHTFHLSSNRGHIDFIEQN